MERFVEAFVRRPVTTFVVVVVMVILGVYASFKLEMALMPDVEFPTIMMMIPAYGSTNIEIEQRIVKPLERVLSTLSGLERIESRIYSNYAMIVMNFAWGTNMDGAMLDLSEKLDMAKMYLPRNFNPMIFKFSPDMMPIVVLAISGEDWNTIHDTAIDIKTTLERLPEVSYVMDMGLRVEEIQVRVDYKKLISNGVGLSMVPMAITSANSVFSGGVEIGPQKYHPINVTTKLESIEDLKKILLPKGSGFGPMMSQMMGGLNISSFMGPKPSLELVDVSKIEVGLRETNSVARFMGRPSAFLVIQKRSGVNMVTACQRVKEALSEMRFPDGIDVVVEMDQSEYITESLDTLMRNLLIGAVVVVLVLLIFLRDVRVVFLVATAIPVSILVGTLLMYFSGMTINVMSLGGLALAVGMLIDNAIVVTESIYRKSEEGKIGISMASTGAGEVGAAITASTLTTISVFMPIAFMQGFAERMFKDLALAVTFTLLASLFVSLTFVPSVSRFVVSGSEPRLRKLRDVYKRVLSKALKRKWLVIGTITVLFILAMVFLYTLGFTLMPTASMPMFRITFDLPAGTSPRVSEKVVKEIEDYLMSNSKRFKVQYIFSYYGMDESGMANMFAMNAGYESGYVAVRLNRKEDLMPFEKMKSIIEKELFPKLKEEYSGIELGFLTPMTFQTELFGRPVEVEIRGEDYEKLREISKEIVNRLSKLSFAKDLRSTVDDMIETQLVVPDQSKLLARKLSPIQIAAEIQAVHTRQSAGTMIYKGRVMDISVYPENVGNVPVKDVVVPNMFGVRVRVGDVAEVRRVLVPVEIIHRDGRKMAIVSMDLEGISQSEALKKVESSLSDLRLPDGYSIKITGEAQTTQREIRQVIIAALIGILLMYMIMAGTFESFIQPMIIMTTVPLGLMGVALAYLFILQPINIVAMIGVVMLFGIVVNNGIVMIDYMNRLRRNGKSVFEAVVEGAATRLRPVLMTSLTTITALIPELILKGEGKEYHAPMAATVVGGLTVATFLTLFFVPALYLVVTSRKERS